MFYKQSQINNSSVQTWNCPVEGYSKALLQKLCFTNEIICIGTSLPDQGEENWKWLNYFVVWPYPKPSLCMQPANLSSWLTTCLRATRSLVPRQKQSPNMSHARRHPPTLLISPFRSDYCSSHNTCSQGKWNQSVFEFCLQNYCCFKQMKWIRLVEL